MIGPALAQQACAGVAARVAAHVPQHFHGAELFGHEAPRRLLHPGIGAFRQDDAPTRAPRPLVDAIAEAHFLNFCLSAWCTAG